MPEDPEQDQETTEKKDSEKLSPKEEEKVLEESKKRLKMCEEAERSLREKALEDLRFRAGEQWDAEVARRRKARKKPCLTINPIPAREHQITNEYRQNRSWIQVDPVDDKADPDTADIFQGLIRHIEYDSDVDDAQDTGLISAVRMGFGFMRVLLEWESPTSFQQVIKVDRIRNPFQVYLDCAASRADRSDAKYGHIYETLTKDEYKESFEDSDLCASLDTAAPGTRDPEWLSKDGIRVAEYFRIEEKEHALYLCQIQGVPPFPVLDDDWDKVVEALPKEYRSKLKKIDERETKIPAVHWYKHNAVEVLDHKPWPGRWVPIIPILGDELDVDGELILEGIVRHAKDPIRVYNSMASAQVEAIYLAPKAPWVVDAKSIKQYENQWKTSNSENWAYLPYDSTDPSNPGKQYPEPKREAVEPPIMAITSAKMQAADDIRNTTGIHEAQLGQPSNEKSGKAIAARKMQGELSNFHFTDNMSRARRFLGRQLVDLIPKVYSVPMQVRIIGEDGAQKVVKVNQDIKQSDNSTKKYDLTVGRYDVTISNEPSWQTKRQEQSETLVQLTSANPSLMPIAGDIMLGAMDIPDHEKLAQRYKKFVQMQFPGMVEDETDSDPKVQLQQAQVQLQALSQQHKQLTQALNHEIEINNSKQVEQQAKLQQTREQEASKQAIAKMESDAKLAIVKMQEVTKIAVAQINASKDANQQIAEQEMQQYQLMHEASGKVFDAAHERVMADAQHQREMEAQQGQQDFESEQAQNQQDFERQQTAQAQAHEADQADADRQAAADQAAAAQSHEASQADLEREATAEQAELNRKAAAAKPKAKPAKKGK